VDFVSREEESVHDQTCHIMFASALWVLSCVRSMFCSSVGFLESSLSSLWRALLRVCSKMNQSSFCPFGQTEPLYD